MNKKSIIFETAIRLFAAQGYEATTTLQIAREVGVTEPAVFYHFKSKSAFFSTILDEASIVYLNRIDALALSDSTAFESLEALIRLHFSVVAEETEFMRILLRTCPVRLENPESTCTKVYREARSKLKTILKKILEKGMASDEFVQVDMDAISNMLIAMLNGLMRQQIVGMDDLDGIEKATIEFCRNALVAKK
ncbi:TetR/AcrR family transcriptional regulator [Desulfosarcina sp.]|nr:TetR/AcrR family transcriptional regulator [Desulfosarcina sp.]